MTDGQPSSVVSKSAEQRDSKGTDSIHCIDLFCGVGGLTHGLIRGGVRVVAGIDLDGQCRYAYERNNNAVFIERNVSDVSAAELFSLFGQSKIRLLAGCAPCQPFSTYSRKGRRSRTDNKWDLVLDFARLIKASEPDLVTMENVPQFTDHSVFSHLLEALDGYYSWWRVVECADFGVPQTRKRLVLLASRFGPIEFMPPQEAHITTVRASISHLPKLIAGETDECDALHAACSLSDLNLRRIKASKPGGTWRDWEPTLVATCHRKDSGQTYPSVYGRMEWDAPAPTITTQCFGYGNGRFGHPEQNRAISLREAAILQTFPDNYRFLAPGQRVRFNSLGRLIGNAVPVRIGEAIGRSLVSHARKYRQNITEL